VYLLPVAGFLFPPTKGIENLAIGVWVVAWPVSVVHAFAIRTDYVVRLERRLQETAGEARLPGAFEAEYMRRVAELSPAEARQYVSSDPALRATGEHLGKPAPDLGRGLAPGETPSPEAGPPSSESDDGSQDEPPSVAPAEVQTGSPAREQSRNTVSAEQGDSVRGSSVTSKEIAETYPLPIAYSWSLLEDVWDPRDRYREQLRHAENMLAFLGSISLAILDENDHERAQLDLKIPWQGGISFGAWKLIVQRCVKVFRSYGDHPLANDIRKLNIGSEDKGVGADVAALISARNDFHHARGPVMEEDIADATNEAQERLERFMEALSFFTRYPIRLVQDFDVDRRNGEFILKCVRLVGDGPGFPQEKIIFPRALPRGDLALDLGDRN
jgi:hypothetical protein